MAAVSEHETNVIRSLEAFDVNNSSWKGAWIFDSVVTMIMTREAGINPVLQKWKGKHCVIRNTSAPDAWYWLDIYFTTN